MKECIYLRADVAEHMATAKVAVKTDKGVVYETPDMNTKFAIVDHELGLAHDDLARAMYMAVKCPVNLSVDDKARLRKAVEAGEIGQEYLV